MAKTVAAFRTELMNEFGLSETNSNDGTSSNAILQYINEANALFINYRPWKFRNKTYTATVQPALTVLTSFTTTSTTIALNTPNVWPSTGRFIIEYDIIQYTANNGVLLTIAAGQADRLHDAGEHALFLVPVPPDYLKYKKMRLNDQEMYVADMGNSSTEPYWNRFFELEIDVGNGTRSKFFVFPYTTTIQNMTLLYTQAATDYSAMDPATSYIEIPQPYWNFVKEYVFSRIYYHLEETSQGQLREGRAMDILKKAAVFDSKQHNGNRVPLRTQYDNQYGRFSGDSFGYGLFPNQT